MTDRELMQMALDVIQSEFATGGKNIYDPDTVIEALRDRLAQPEPEPVEWFYAPLKTEWGEDMVAADLAIDNDHMVSIYCEADQIEKVEAMFGLTKIRGEK